MFLRSFGFDYCGTDVNGACRPKSENLRKYLSLRSNERTGAFHDCFCYGPFFRGTSGADTHARGKEPWLLFSSSVLQSGYENKLA